MERAIAKNLKLARQNGDQEQIVLTQEFKTIFEQYKKRGLRDLAEKGNSPLDVGKNAEVQEFPAHRDDEIGWQSQIDLLVALKYHHALDMSEDEYRSSLPMYKTQPEQFSGRFDTTLLVDPRVSRREQMQLMDMPDANSFWIGDFEDTPKFREPYQVWVQDGSRYLKKNALAFAREKADDERGMNSLEAIALYRELPDLVSDHGIILPGSISALHGQQTDYSVLTMGRLKNEAVFRFHFADTRVTGRHIFGAASCGILSE